MTAPDAAAGSARLGSGAMFDGIAARYDLVNRILSLGIDQRWRRRAVRALSSKDEPRAPRRVLDVATGTGDLAIMIARAYRDCEVVGIDPSTGMLEVGRTKVTASGLGARIDLQVAEAEALPFEDASFDGVTIAFGIRNVPDRLRGLEEMCRVTRPGGRVVVLELAEPEGGLTGAVARFHVHRLVPAVGGWISGRREYSYLQRSIAAFPTATEFAATMTEAGLVVQRVERLTFGVAHVYVGVRPEAS